MDETQKEQEKNFFDYSYEAEARKSVSKLYGVENSSGKYYENILLANCSKKKILEYGCGTGSYAFTLSKYGTEVIGIDISEVAIKMSKEKAQNENLKNVDFFIMDAEAMHFENRSFDLVCGSGILHHLNIEKASSELNRVLNSNGKAIFIEPMGYNPFINLFRKLTPHIRTKDEHPLILRDIHIMEKYFNKVECKYFNFFSLFTLPFRNLRFYSSLKRTFDKLDEYLFKKIPFMKFLAWQIVVVLEKPNLLK